MCIRERFHTNRPMIDPAIRKRLRIPERAPVIFLLKNTSTSRTVADCFATGAESIYDALTHEAWVKEDGSFVKVD